MLWKLIKLELKKTRWRGLLLSAVVTILMLVLWVVGSDIPNNDVDSYDRAFQSIMNYVGITFVIFASVLMSRMIIDEYRNKTVTILFVYPVPRNMIFAAKLVIIGVWTFLTVIIGHLVVSGALLVANSHYHYIAEPLTRDRLWEEALRIIIIAVIAAGLSLVPLFFGMLRKTMPALIISSFIISNSGMVVMNNDVLYQNLQSMSILALVSVGFGSLMAYLGVRRSGEL
ncbi:ABC transporter permease [Paenibacillus sp. CF384]|uniref:ABC transporter permease n=1 Tax=Paenibacillus sp. CF384 TaxID=1884382 RepID=UPI00089B0FBB|nr:ABC transporter permease [Paenibacillus sp. CF384]SDW19858.1 ABC-2 family transporter protein [Paenibacillus sp. CF384]